MLNAQATLNAQETLHAQDTYRALLLTTTNSRLVKAMQGIMHVICLCKHSGLLHSRVLQGLLEAVSCCFKLCRNTEDSRPVLWLNILRP